MEYTIIIFFTVNLSSFCNPKIVLPYFYHKVLANPAVCFYCEMNRLHAGNLAGSPARPSEDHFSQGLTR